MSGIRSLFGSSQPSTTPEYTGLQIQTAVNTLPVPIVWGMARVAPNLIWYANFQTISSQGGKSGGGKGGGLFSSNNNVTYTYTADVALALCEGPIVNINSVWKNQSIYTLGELGLGLFIGSTPQAVWGYLADTDPSQALGYQGTAYLAAASYQLSTAATLDNHNFEVQGLRYGTGYGQTPYTTYVAEIYDNVTLANATSSQNSTIPFNGVNPASGFFDADPAWIISDFLTSTQFGAGAPSGFPASSIASATLFGSGNDASLQTYCRAVGIALSPALTDQEQASSILQRWLQLCNCAAVWSNGQLKFIPYGDYTVVGNGITFVPDATPIYDLADDDFVYTDNEDPLEVARTDPYEAYNVWRMECADRSNQYNLTTVESRDQNAIELYGMRIAPTVTAHEICDTGVALIAGQLMLQRAVYIRNTFKLKLSWECCLLDPMDLVTVTDAILGLSKFPVRITDIEEDENGILQVTAEEFPQGAQTATLYATASANNNPVNRNVNPGAANTPIIFEPTDALAGGLQVWIALSGQSALWGGANVLVSLSADGDYTPIGNIAAARMGALSAQLLAVTANPTGGATIDNVNTLIVDLTESRGVLDSASQAAALAGGTPCYVGGEIVNYTTATLTASNKYNLTGLIRGADDTESAIVNHPAATPFAFLDEAIFKYGYDQSLIGQTLYFKFQGFNIFGGGLQSLADCPAYPYVLTGAALASPLPNVTNLRSVYNVNTGFQELVWDFAGDFRPVTFVVKSGSSAAAAMTLSANTSSPFTVPGDSTYWVAAVSQPANGLTVYSEIWQSVTISGAVITQNVVKTVDLKALNWPGTFSGGAGVDSTLNAIRTGGGDILSDTNVLTTSDVLDYGGGLSGSYFPDDNAYVDIGYVANASVVIAYQPTGVPVGQNMLAIGDFLDTADILGAASTQFIDIYPEIWTGTVAGGDLYSLGDLYQYADLYVVGGVNWNPVQKFAPGTYQARYLYFDFRLFTVDPQTIAYNLAAKIIATLPARIDQYPLTTSSSADTTVIWGQTGVVSSAPLIGTASPFNGGGGPSNLPALNWGITDAQAGDDLIVTALSLTAISFKILNGGSRVVRSLTLTAEGY